MSSTSISYIPGVTGSQVSVSSVSAAGSKTALFINNDSVVINPGDVIAVDFAALDLLIDDGPVTGSGVAQALDGIKKVKRTSALSTGAPGAVGVCLTSGTVGGTFHAVVGGFCPFVKTDAGVAAGDYIVPDNAGTGTCDTYLGSTHTTAPPLGIALNADSALGCAALIFPSPLA